MPKTRSTNALLARAAKAHPKPREPLWRGPGGAGPQGGVTQGMLGRYLSCRERFRVKVIDGWVPAPRFEPRLEYGNFWHACEEALAAGGNVNNPSFFKLLEAYHARLARQFPLARPEIGEWAAKAYQFFPRYVKYWAAHPDVRDRTPLLQEQVFDVPYRLPSGRTVRLRGKWDSVDLIGKGGEAGVYIQENKTKSTIDGAKIGRQVAFDLQSMFYVTALDESDEDYSTTVCTTNVGTKGVRYNCVRRPAHKTVDSAVKKFDEDERAGRIGEWFARWKVEIGPTDLQRFRRECLNPVLENLADDYEWWEFCTTAHPRYGVFDYTARAMTFPTHRARHFTFPLGIYNPLSEGGGSDLDEYLLTGSTAGLERTKNLFPELQEV